MLDASVITRPPLTELRKRIHVGCGPHALKRDWLNVDVRRFAGIDLVFDVTQPWTELSCVEYVYGEHFLEHLDFTAALDFFEHARGAMGENGTLRLSTPALEWVLSTHFDVNGTDPERTINDTFSINRAFHGWGHCFLWSKEMLDRALKASGFAEVTFCGYGESTDAVLRGLEEHGGYKVQNGFPSTWILDARKRGGVVDPKFRELGQHMFQRYVRGGH